MKIDRTAIDQRLQFLADKLSKLKTDDEYRNFLIAFIQENHCLISLILRRMLLIKNSMTL